MRAELAGERERGNGAEDCGSIDAGGVDVVQLLCREWRVWSSVSRYDPHAAEPVLAR